MEELQMKALSTCEKPPYHWPWYVDDSEALMDSMDHAQSFLDHLNSMEPGVIVFTMEVEDNGSISVLDLKSFISWLGFKIIVCPLLL